MNLGTLAAVLSVAAIALAIWGHTPASERESETFRYKLTINVRVNGVPYSASSVIEANQRRSNCPWWGFSGSGASGGCYPDFTARGVAPMIRLPDGAVIFASLRGFFSDNPPGVRGTSAARRPWQIYVDEWLPGVDIQAYANLPLIRLPAETPRVEIPFEGHPKSKFRPPMEMSNFDHIKLSLGRSMQIGPSNARERTGRAIDLISFAIEPTDDALQTCIEPVPPWLVTVRNTRRMGALRSLIETCGKD